MGEQKGGAQALQRFDERRFLHGKLKVGIGAGLQREQGMGRIGHPAAVPRLGQVVFRHSGEDRRVEESFEVGGSADRGVSEFARDGGRTSDDGSSGERERGEPGQAGSGGVVRRRTERGTDDGEVAGVETFKDAGLLETAQQAGVESAALVGLLTGEPESDGGAGEPGGQVLLLLECVAGGTLRLQGNVVVAVGALAEAMDFLLDRVLDIFEVGALFGDGGPVLAIAIGGFGDLRFGSGFLRTQRLEQGEGVLRVRPGGGIATQPGEGLGIAALDGAPDGFAHDAAGFRGGEPGIEGIESCEDDVVRIVVAVGSGDTVHGGSARIERVGLLA